MIDQYGEDVGVRHARKHIGWYLETLAPDTPASQKIRLMTSTRSDEVVKIFSEVLEKAAIAPAAMENAA